MSSSVLRPRFCLLGWVVLVAFAVLLNACDSGNEPAPEPLPNPIAAPTVTGLTVLDNGDGTLRVSFNQAVDASKVKEYRVIAIAVSDITSFTLEAANAVGADRYTVVAKTGSDLSVVLPAETKDKDGNSLLVGEPYRIYILTVADGAKATVNALSAPSSPVTITMPGAGLVSNLRVSDVTNNGNGTDLQVSFNRAADESTVAEYRIMVVTAAAAGAFDLEDAEAVALHFTTISKTGQDISVTLPEGAVDVDGAAIINGVSYRIFVLSVADGVTAQVNALAGPSAPITLIIPAAGVVANVVVDDVTNHGNGSDLQISFDRAADESTLSEYRILVVRSEQAGAFDLGAANAVIASRYTAVAKTGEDVTTVLPVDATDTDGAPVADTIPYTVFVLSVADGVMAGINSLSSGSNPVTLAVTTVKVTYVGNDGVLITDGEKTVIIDGLQRGIGWVDLSSTETARIEQAQPPYDVIDVAMITHNHTDHYSRQSIAAYLNNNTTVRVLAPPQVRNNLSGLPRVEATSPAFHTREDVTLNGVDITIYHLRHFNQFGNDFSNVQNYGYLVRLGGLKLLHLGDVDYSVDNFQNFNLSDENIDIVFLPTFNTLISAQNRDVILDQINPKLVIGLHFQRARVASESAQVLGLYPTIDVLTTPLESRRY